MDDVKTQLSQFIPLIKPIAITFALAPALMLLLGILLVQVKKK
jgi:hypothetical protein